MPRLIWLLACLSGLSPAALAGQATTLDRTMALVEAWVHGGYDNTWQADAESAADVALDQRHRVMFQLFAPVDIPAIPGHTVYQQASVDGSTDPDRIWRNGVLQFFRDPDTGSVRLRELNFKQPADFHNAQFRLQALRALTLADFEWNPGCDFLLVAAADDSLVRGPIVDCRLPLPGRDGEMIADDEVVITADEFWFLGRYRDADGVIMWGNTSDEHTKLRRTASLDSEAMAGVREGLRREQSDAAETVRDALGFLSEEYRTAINLHCIMGYSYDEAGDIMGVPGGTVKTYVHRGKARLKEILCGDEA